ncbi:MAG: putative oxidoreductase C-terminal domain-containing protein [Ferruginibacter sp.]
MNKFLLLFGVCSLVISCDTSQKKVPESSSMVRLITLDPGHFHAALVQKSMYPQVDSVVQVYAPAGADLQFHLDRITAFNNRAEAPTHWKEEVYSATDYFDKMLAEKKGNVVVLAGDNQRKTEYILKSLEAGLNVLADKPMAINAGNFETLKKAFETAKEKNLLLYDIMTERFEITTMLQRELSMVPEIFGALQKGTIDNPAVSKISHHCFYKYISGSVLTRPAWFMDVTRQGEGIVDVTTHLVDLVQWECFPEQAIDYTKDINVLTAKHWPTNMSFTQFKTITKLDSIPSSLTKNVVNDSLLQIYSNGEINYEIRGVHAKVSVIWDYQSPAGGDTHYSIMRGTKANLVVKQGAEQQYKPSLYIEQVISETDYETTLTEQIKKLRGKYPGIELKKVSTGWEVIIPENYKEGHEAHFARVTQKFLEYFTNHNIPQWEVEGMLAKYYTTTKALEIALKTKP